MRIVDKKLIILLVVILLSISTVLIGYNLDLKNQLKIYNMNKIVGVKSNKLVYNIDSINLDEASKTCTIEGWAILKGTNCYNIIPTVILKGKNGDIYKLNTRIVTRSDITKFYNGSLTDTNTHLTCETIGNEGVTKYKNVYDNSGLIAKFNFEELNKNESYDIGIQLDDNSVVYFGWTKSKVEI